MMKDAHGHMLENDAGSTEEEHMQEVIRNLGQERGLFDLSE
jgi:hypothetical protein